VGCSIVLSYKDRAVDAKVYRKIVVRTLKLIGLGLFLGAFTIHFPFFKDFEEIRFPGVLQRIGVVFFFTSLLFIHFNWKVLVGICAFLLMGYWLWLGYVPIQGMAPTFERAANNWANFADLQVFGTHMYKKDYDPEGLLSTFPSVVTALLGTFTGLILRSNKKKKELLLMSLGLAMLAVGYVWSVAFPINKALWSSSFVMVTAGWANILLALIYYGTDVKGLRFGSLFGQVGANAITVYFLSSFISKLFYLIKVDGENAIHGWLFQTIYVHGFVAMETSSLLYALSVVGFYVLLAHLLYRKKIFIKV
jgi:predicted acyltransferase